MPSDMGEESEAAKTGGVLEKHEFCDFVGTGTKMKGAIIHGANLAVQRGISDIALLPVSADSDAGAEWVAKAMIATDEQGHLCAGEASNPHTCRTRVGRTCRTRVGRVGYIAP
jgi:hypothetical protein